MGRNDTAEHPVYGDDVNSLFDVIRTIHINKKEEKTVTEKRQEKRINNLTMEG